MLGCGRKGLELTAQWLASAVLPVDLWMLVQWNLSVAMALVSIANAHQSEGSFW